MEDLKAYATKADPTAATEDLKRHVSMRLPPRNAGMDERKD
jgi:hypothetical protein